MHAKEFVAVNDYFGSVHIFWMGSHSLVGSNRLLAPRCMRFKGLCLCRLTRQMLAL